jgi:hypothetical protein
MVQSQAREDIMDPNQLKQDKSVQDLLTTDQHMMGLWSSLRGHSMDLFDPREEIIMSMTSKDLHSPWTAIDLHQPAPTFHGHRMPG